MSHDLPESVRSSVPPVRLAQREEEAQWTRYLGIARIAAGRVLRGSRSTCHADIDDLTNEIALEVLLWTRQGKHPSSQVFRFAAHRARQVLWPKRLRTTAPDGGLAEGDENLSEYEFSARSTPDVPVADRMQVHAQLAQAQRLHEALSPDAQRVLTLLLSGHTPAEIASETGRRLKLVCDSVHRIEGYLATGTLPVWKGVRGQAKGWTDHRTRKTDRRSS